MHARQSHEDAALEGSLPRGGRLPFTAELRPVPGRQVPQKEPSPSIWSWGSGFKEDGRGGSLFGSDLAFSCLFFPGNDYLGFFSLGSGRWASVTQLQTLACSLSFHLFNGGFCHNAYIYVKRIVNNFSSVTSRFHTFL